MPTASSCSRGPMPDSMSRCGDPTAPALRTTSVRAVTTCVVPSSARYSTPVARSAPGSPSTTMRVDVGVGDDRQVGALFDLALEEGVIGAGALAVADRGLQQRDQSGRAAAVAAVVVAQRDAGRDGGVDEGLRAGHHGGPDGDAERPVGAVRVRVDRDVVAGDQAFALAEVGQDLVVAPAGRAVLRPRVEVAGVAAHVGQVVHARRPAEHLAARHHHAAVVQAASRATGVRGEHPVGFLVELQHRAGHWHEFGGRGMPTGLEQDDARVRILGEPRGDDRTG